MSTPRRRDDEGGFTVVELMVALMLVAIFSLAVQTSLNVFTRTVQTTHDKASALGDVRVAEERIARDLRAASPLDDISPEPVSNYETKVGFAVFCSNAGVGECGSGGVRRVTYRLVSNRLERVVGSSTRVLVGPNAQSAVPVEQRLGAVINGAGEPLFTYLDKTGAVLTTSGPQAVTTRRIHDCARAIQIHLKVVSEPRKTTTPYNLVTKVELRNFSEVSGC